MWNKHTHARVKLGICGLQIFVSVHLSVTKVNLKTIPLHDIVTRLSFVFPLDIFISEQGLEVLNMLDKTRIDLYFRWQVCYVGLTSIM